MLLTKTIIGGKKTKPEIEKPVAAAAQADIIITCIGENSYCETPGNLTDLTLSENQRNLVKALAATGKPIVLYSESGTSTYYQRYSAFS